MSVPALKELSLAKMKILVFALIVVQSVLLAPLIKIPALNVQIFVKIPLLAFVTRAFMNPIINAFPVVLNVKPARNQVSVYYALQLTALHQNVLAQMATTSLRQINSVSNAMPNYA